MSDFKDKMHQIRFWLGLTALPRPPSWIYGAVLLRGEEGKEEVKEERGRGGEGTVLHPEAKTKVGAYATNDVLSSIGSIYDELIDVMVSCACSYVPRCPKNFFKFWWDEELKSLKEASVNTDKL